MIEGLLLVIELIFFALLLWNVSRRGLTGAAEELGLFAYRNAVDKVGPDNNKKIKVQPSA